MGRLLATLLLATTPALGLAASEIRVAVVLDASEEMWLPLADGRPRAVAARMALQSWALERAADEQLVAGLRLAGGESALDDRHPCQSSTLLLPLGGVDPSSWLERLDGVRPSGPRPLLLTVADAAADLGDASGPRRVVVVTSGEDSCFGSARPVAAAISRGIDVRVVGVGLTDPAVERFSSVAPTRNVTSTSALLAALRWAVEELPSSTPDEEKVRLRLEGLPEASSAALIDTVTGARFDLESSRRGLEGAALPGRYALEIQDEGERATTVSLEGIDVAAGSGCDLDIQVPSPPLPILDPAPERPTAGGPVLVAHSPAGSQPWLLVVARPNAPSLAWIDARTLDDGGLLELRAPEDPGPYEVRLLERLSGGQLRCLARAAIESVAAEATVEAPEEIRPFEPLPVVWTGPANDGDRIIAVPAGSSGALPAACIQVGSAPSPADLTAPGDEGAFEVRYVGGASGRVLARTRLKVTRIIVTVTPPSEVKAGRPFEVVWEGPAAPADFLAISAHDAPDDDYISFAPAAQGNPASLVAPAEPGDYEVRYVDGTSGRVARRAELTVAPIEVQLDGPRRARAGTRFQVRWRGPDRTGDFIAVARPDDPPDATADWTPTSLGSPLSLAAPFEGGEYEIRYVTDQGRTILARAPLAVR